MHRTLLLSLIILAACSLPPVRPAETAGPESLTVMTHDSFAASQAVIGDFERENNAKVTFLQGGDAGAALNKAILTKDAPLADVFYGVDNTFLSRALDADIFEPYQSPALKDVYVDLQLDPSNRALPVDLADVCINYDRAYFSAHSLPIPVSLEDLTRPEYRNLLVVENPATSSPGLAFLLATVKHFGDPGYIGYWKDLRQNGLVVVDGWETAYYTNFSGSSGRGPQPMVVSYATSPAAEVMFATSPLTDAPTASILEPDTCFRQIEFVGILKGTQHRLLAEKFVDFMLGPEFQNDVPGQMFVYPVIRQAGLPEAFSKYAHPPAQPASLPPEEIAQNREAWIAAWTEAVLR
jgi:thiamine transport system substrate-binding protein